MVTLLVVATCIFALCIGATALIASAQVEADANLALSGRNDE